MIVNDNQISSYLIKNFSDIKSEKFFVHSIFKHTINFTNDKLLFSVSPKLNFSPINISIESNLFDLIYNYLHNYKSINLNFPYIDFNFYETNLNSFSLINTQIEFIKLPTEDYIRDFIFVCLNSINNSESLINIFQNSEPTDAIIRKFKMIHRKFTEILQCNNVSSYRNILDEISGFGKGLTPAGDDFLYGILATWKTFSLRQEFVSYTEKYILENQNKFNLISFNFLKSLIEGEISLTVKNILINISPQKDYKSEITVLLNYGHTSGGDILTGILTAIQNK